VVAQATFEKLENEMKEINSNAETLKRNFLDLTELKHILRKTQSFFDEVRSALQVAILKYANDSLLHYTFSVFTTDLRHWIWLFRCEKKLCEVSYV